MTWKERMSGWLAGIIHRATPRHPERREASRFAAEIPVVISLVQEQEILTMRALAKGISLGGFSAPGLEALPVGQSVSLEIHLPISPEPLWAEGVVRHSGGSHGVQFVSLSEAQQKLIKRYCRLQPRQKRHSA